MMNLKHVARFASALAAIVLIGSGCTDSALFGSATSSSGGGGSNGGFDGKVFVQMGRCPDGSTGNLLKVKVFVSLQFATTMEENCAVVNDSTNVFADLDTSNSISLVYRPTGSALQQEGAARNEMLTANPASVSGTVGVAFNVGIRMNAVPMGLEGYQVCLFFVDASNSVPAAHNCFWPALRSDTASGFEEFNVQPLLPSGTPTGRYLITASYVRFNGTSYQAVPLTMGSGVTQSPEVGAPFAYVIGELDLN
jgi:hypothetical protein